MQTTETLRITFEDLAGAYGTRLLSEEAFLILLSLVPDSPQLSRLKTAPKALAKGN